MKKTIGLIALCLLLFSCAKEGEILNKATKNIEINGKEYYFIKVVPADGEYGVWLLIPKDSKVEIPEHTSIKVSCGKSCHRNLNAIWVKS